MQIVLGADSELKDGRIGFNLLEFVDVRVPESLAFRRLVPAYQPHQERIGARIGNLDFSLLVHFSYQVDYFLDFFSSERGRKLDGSPAREGEIVVNIFFVFFRVPLGSQIPFIRYNDQAFFPVE